MSASDDLGFGCECDALRRAALPALIEKLRAERLEREAKSKKPLVKKLTKEAEKKLYGATIGSYQKDFRFGSERINASDTNPYKGKYTVTDDGMVELAD